MSTAHLWPSALTLRRRLKVISAVGNIHNMDINIILKVKNVDLFTYTSYCMGIMLIQIMDQL